MNFAHKLVHARSGRFLSVSDLVFLSQNKKILWFGEYHSEKRIVVLLEELVRGLLVVSQSPESESKFSDSTSSAPSTNPAGVVVPYNAGGSPPPSSSGASSRQHAPTTSNNLFAPTKNNFPNVGNGKGEEQEDHSSPSTGGGGVGPAAGPARRIGDNVAPGAPAFRPRNAPTSAAGGGRPLQLMLEHFSLDMQPLLRRFQTHKIDWEELVHEYGEMGSEGHDLGPYRNLLELCVQNDVELLAGFIPRPEAAGFMKAAGPEEARAILTSLEKKGYLPSLEQVGGAVSWAAFRFVSCCGAFIG